MRVAGLFGPGLSCKQRDQGRLAIHQEVQRRMDGVQVIERIHTLGAGPQFAGSLRTAEEQHADQGDFVPMEVEDIGQAMLELGDTAVAGGGTG